MIKRFSIEKQIFMSADFSDPNSEKKRFSPCIILKTKGLEESQSADIHHSAVWENVSV